MATSGAESPLESGDVAIVGGCDESSKKTCLVSRIRERPSAVSHVLPSATHYLPRVRHFEPKHLRNVAVWIVERLPKDVSGSFRVSSYCC